MSPTTWGHTNPSAYPRSFGVKRHRAKVPFMRMLTSRIMLVATVVSAATGLWGVPSLDLAGGVAQAAESAKKGKRPAVKTSPVIAAAKQYAEAIASGDRETFGRLDFDCQFALVSTAAAPFKAFPPGSDPVYGQCWTILVQAHDAAVEQRDEGVNAIWPGNGFLVFYRNELASYPPSFYVMDRLGLSPPGGGLRVEPVDSAPIPEASFRMRSEEHTSELQSRLHLVCRLLLEKKKK